MPKAKRIWGRSPSHQRIFTVFKSKHSFEHTFLSKKDIPVPAVSALTIIVSDNTKIF